MNKANLQPDSDVKPTQIAVDETTIRVNGQRHWLFAAVDPETNQLLHVRLFQTRMRQPAVLFLRELREKQQVSDVTFLIDDTHHLMNALDRLGLQFRHERRGNRNAVERVFWEVTC